MEHRQLYGSSRGDPRYDGGPYAAGPPGDPWDEPWTDTRTSVFDPPVSYDPAVYDSPDPGPAAGGETYLEDEIPDEEVRQTSIIDSDPFAGRSSSLRRRYGEHYRRDEPLPDEDDDGPRSAVVHRLVIGGVVGTVILLLGAYAFLAGAGDNDRDAAPEGALPSTTQAGDTSITSAPGQPAGEPSADRPAGTSNTSRPAAPAAGRPLPSAPSTAPTSATPSTTAADGNASAASPPPTTAPSGGTGGGSESRDGDRPDEDNDTLLEILGLG